MSSWFEVERPARNVWMLTESSTDSVNCYLIQGEDDSLLVDTGLGFGNIRALVESLTAKPVIAVNTHAHYDHIGGNRLFGAVWAHRAERETIERGIAEEEPGAAGCAIPGVPVARLLEDGDVVDLGGRNLHVLHTPGHSPGSICLWEKEEGLLFCGDVFYRGNLFVCLPGSDFMAYQESLQRLSRLEPAPELVFCGHGPSPLAHRDVVEACCFIEEVAGGCVRGQRVISPWGLALAYRGPGFDLIVSYGASE